MSIVFQAMHAVSGLFARAKRSEEVVNAFLQNERPWMYRLALSITQRPDLAEDAVQETLNRCWPSTRQLTKVNAHRWSFITGVAVQVSENETLRANTDLFAEEVKEMRRAMNPS